jgi:hypothetical protein
MKRRFRYRYALLDIALACGVSLSTVNRDSAAKVFNPASFQETVRYCLKRIAKIEGAK